MEVIEMRDLTWLWTLIMMLAPMGIALCIARIWVIQKDNKLRQDINKAFRRLLLILILGFTFWIHNDTDIMQLAYIYSVDHPLKDKYPYPVNIFGGEVKVGKVTKLVYKQNPGRYIVTFHDYKNRKVTRPRTLRFTVPKEATNVLLRASKMYPEIN